MLKESLEAAAKDSQVTRWLTTLTASSLFVSSMMLPAEANRGARGDMSGQEWRQFRLQQRNAGMRMRDIRQDLRNQRAIPGVVPARNAESINLAPRLELNKPFLENGRQRPRQTPDMLQKENRRGSARRNSMEAAEQRTDKSSTRQNRADRTERINANETARLQRFVIQENQGAVVKLDNGANLDLTTADRNITLGDKLFEGGSSVTIEVGGEKKNLSAGSTVTAAEYIAAKQVLSSGKQQIEVDGSGVAIGGTVDLNAIAATRNKMKAEGLTVAEGVTAIGDLARNSSFRLDGDLNNYGSVVAVATTRGRHSGDINAENIINNEGALISSDTGNKLGNKASAIDLTLNADNDFINSGEIVSSGNLNISAGGTLRNADGASVSAKDNLSLNSSTIANAGMISSAKGDITVDSPYGTEMNVANQGGTFEALKGAINIRSAGNVDALNANFIGGDLLSQQVNFQAGETGVVELHVNELTGTLNGTGYGTHVSAATDVLNLGDVCLTGDPTFKNAAGDINFTGDLTATEALAVLASGNITASNGADIDITARNGSGDGQLITLAAGYALTGTGTDSASLPGGTQATGDITADSAGATGGDIDFSNANSVNFFANGTGFGDDGGDVNLFALNVGATGGNILLPTNSLIDTSSGLTLGGADSGNVTIAGAGNIVVGSINAVDTFGGSGQGGILIRNTNPTGATTFATNGTVASGGFNTAGPVTAGGIAFQSGASVRGNQSVTIDTMGTVTGNGAGGFGINSVNGDLQVNASSISTDGADITLEANNNVGITAASISTVGALDAGNVTIHADNNDGGGGSLNAAGVAINTSGSGAGGAGGDITLDSGDSGGEFLSVGALTSAGSGGGAGGNISLGTIDGSAGDVTIGGDVNAGTGTFTIIADNNDHDVSLGGNTTSSDFSIDIGSGDITATGSGISITTDGYTVEANSFNVGNNPFSLQQLTSGTTIGVAGGAGDLNVSSDELAEITASALSIGTFDAGTITVGSSLDVSGTPGTTPGAYDLAFTTGGNFDGGMNNVTLGDQSLTVDALGSITYGNITGAGGDVDLAAYNGSDTTVGDVTLTTGDMSIAADDDTTTGALTTTDGNITVIAGNDAVIESVDETGAGSFNLVVGDSVTIGEIASNDDVVIQVNGDITVGTTTTPEDIFLYSANGDVTTTGTLTADPIVMTAAGDVNLGGSLVADDGITVVAGQDVSNTTGGIEIDATDGGNVVVVAGADFTVAPFTSVTIDGASATGGSILLDNAGGISAIDSSNSAGDGGDITLAAFANGFGGGQIRTPLTASTTTTGSGANASGDVTVLAGALLGDSIQVGNITTSTSTDGLGGDVLIEAAGPSAGEVIQNDASYSGSFASGGSLLAADIRSGNITARGASVDVRGDANVGVGVVDVSGQANQSGGTINIDANGTDQFDAGLASGENFALGLLANGGSTSGDGGTIDITNLGSTGIRTNPIQIQVTDGDGGELLLNAGQGDLLMNGGVYSVDAAGADTNGGLIRLQGDSLTAQVHVELSAMASGLANGGSVDIDLASGDLTLGGGSGEVSIDTSGFLDVVDVTTGGPLTVADSSGIAPADFINLQTTNPGSNITIDGEITAEAELTIDSDGAVFVNADIDGSNFAGVSAFGNIIGSGVLTANEIELSSATGNIGVSSASRLEVQATDLTANANAGSVFLRDSDDLNLGAGSSSAAFEFDVQANNNLSNSGTVTADDVVLRSVNGDVSLGNSVDGDNSLTLVASDSIVQTSGTLSTPNLALNANNVIDINNTDGGGTGQSIEVSGSADADIVTQETGGVNLEASSADSLILDASNSDVTTAGNIMVANTLDVTVDDQFTNTFNVTAGTINIQSASNPLTFQGGTGGTLTATSPGGVNISAASGALNFFGEQTINGPANFTVTAFNDIVINSGANIVGNDSVTLNTCNLVLMGNLMGDPLILNCPSGGGTIANSTGDVNLSSDIIFNGLNFAIIASGNINATGISTIDLSDAADGGTLTMVAGFDFTPGTGGQVNNTNVLFTMGDNSVTGGSINMGGVGIDVSSTASGDSGDVLAVASAGTNNDGNVTLGNISATAASGAGGNIEVIGAGDISAGSIDTTGSSSDGNVSLNVSQPQRVGSVLVGNGDVLGGGSFVATGATGDGDISLNDIVNVGDGSLSLLNANNVNASNTITAGSLDIDNFDGNSTTNLAQVDVSGDVDVFTGTLTTGGDINSTSGDVDIDANTLNNTFEIAGNSVSVTSLAGSDLTIDGSSGPGGTLTANAGTVDLGVGTTGNVIFEGEQTFNGVTNIDPSTAEAVIVSNNANVLGNDAVNLNTCNLILQGTGMINGDPLNFNCPDGAGTIANSSGDVNLTGVSLNFVGQSLAILASGNIFAGTATSIDLSDPSGDGGSLLAVAGFEFTPGTGGGQINTPNPTVYTLDGTPSVTGGSIDFSGLNITTSGGDGDAGDVTLVARAGLINTGFVNVGNITANSVNGFGGDVLIIGEGGTTTGTFSTNGTLGDGVVTLAAAQPTIVNGPILAQNGEQAGPGQFAFGPPTGAGTIANSNGDVDLSGLNLTFVGLDLAIIASGDISAGSTTLIDLSNPGGSAGDLLAVAGFDFTPATAGQVDFDNVTNFVFTGPSVTGGDIQFGNLDIVANGGAGDGGDVTLVASAGTLNNGTIVASDITATGTQSGGDILLIAEGGFIINGNIDNSGDVTNGTTVLAAAAPVISGGPITVNNGTQGGPGQFTFTTPTGAGTIANSAGNVNLATDLTFVGQNLAILAANNINTTGATVIDLSGVDSGALTMIAGYDFSPATGGQVTDSATTFSIDSENAVGGNIDLESVNVILSGTNSGGTLRAVANGGSSFVGMIELGNITTEGAAVNGDVLLIGEGGILTGQIDAAGGPVAGDVTLSSAQPVVTGVTVKNGEIVTGTFDTGALTAGEISTGGVASGGTIAINTNRAAGLVINNALNAAVAVNLNNQGGAINTNSSITAGDDIMITSQGLTTDNTVVAGGDIMINALGGAVTLNSDLTATGSFVSIDNASSFTSAGNIAAEGNVTLDIDGDLLVDGDITSNSGVISLLVNDNPGEADLLTVNGSLTASLGIDIVNEGTDRKIDILTFGTGASVETTAKTPGLGDVNIRMGQVSDPLKNNRLSKAKFDVIEIGGQLNLFGRKPRGEKPINTLTAEGADVNITLQKSGFNSRQLVFNGGVNVTADPPVPVGTPIYVNGRLTGYSETFGGNNPGIAVSFETQPHASAFGDSSLTSAVVPLSFQQFDNALLIGSATSKSADFIGASQLSLNSTSVSQINDQRTASIIKGGIEAFTEDNSYVVSYEGPTFETEAMFCSDTDIGITPGAGISSLAHQRRVSLNHGNVLFAPSVDTVVETPHGLINIAARSVAMVSASNAHLAVYDLDDAHKNAVTIETRGQKWALAPGCHVSLSNARSEFAQVNAIEAIPHRNVASTLVKPDLKAHTSEFSVASALNTIKPLKAIMCSKNPQAQKMAGRMVKTTAVLLHLGDNAEFQHYFKPAMTAMAK